MYCRWIIQAGRVHAKCWQAECGGQNPTLPHRCNVPNRDRPLAFRWLVCSRLSGVEGEAPGVVKADCTNAYKKGPSPRSWYSLCSTNLAHSKHLSKQLICNEETPSQKPFSCQKIFIMGESTVHGLNAAETLADTYPTIAPGCTCSCGSACGCPNGQCNCKCMFGFLVGHSYRLTSSTIETPDRVSLDRNDRKAGGK